jgi:predicted secreted protein
MWHDVCSTPGMRIITSALAAFFLLSSVGLAACSTSSEDDNIVSGEEASSEDELKSLVLTEADNGRTINVPEGQNVVVKLSSNPSTGYEWSVASTDRTFGYPYYKKFLPDQSGAVGSGGVQRMTWKTKGGISMVGRHEVKLEYKRPWETNGAAARTFKFVVEIRAVVCPQIEPNPPGYCQDGELKRRYNGDGCFLGSECVNKPVQGACVVGGCSGQICADRELFSTCEMMPEYACYQGAECKRQEDGLCGFTMTPTLMQCLTSQGGSQ